ncbi:MAG: ATP-binding protein [Deltaproteobacteria bacterium]|nr:ATP-binding protein [Deltaproteobacteria bacterium]
MDKKIFIGPPDFEARLDLIKLYMEDRPQKSIDWLNIAEKTEFYTSAELEHVINEAAKRALEERRPITKDDLLASVNDNPPTLNGNRIERMKSPIGFGP